MVSSRSYEILVGNEDGLCKILIPEVMGAEPLFRRSEGSPTDQGLGHVRCLRPLVKTRAFGMTPLVDGRNFQTEPLPAPEFVRSS